MKKNVVLALLLSSASLISGTAQELDSPSKPPLTKDLPLLSEKLPNSPQMGLAVDPLSDQLREHFGVNSGVFVRLVVAGSAAEKAGIREGDILISVNDETILDASDLYALIRSHGVGDRLKVALLRAGKPESANVTLDAPPQESAAQEINHLGLGDFLQKQLEQLGTRLDDRVDLNQLDQIEKLLGRQIFDIRRAGAVVAEAKTLRIEIDRSGDGPAIIRITKDGKTTETNQDALDKLPAEVRPMLEQLLGVAGRLTVDLGGMAIEIPYPVSPSNKSPAAGSTPEAQSPLDHPEPQSGSQTESLDPPTIQIIPLTPRAKAGKQPPHAASQPPQTETTAPNTRSPKSLEQMRQEVERMQQELEQLQRELKRSK
jgi:hypothetical protein